MSKWWLKNGPPVYVAVAGYMGLIKDEPTTTGKTKTSVPKAQQGNLNDLLSMAGAGGIIN